MAYHPPQSGNNLGVATLIGVMLVLAVSFANWREISGIEGDLDGRLEAIDTQIAQLSDKVGKIPTQPAAQRRSGPDPDKVYTIKTDGAFAKGPSSAVVTIAEFSDFQ